MKILLSMGMGFSAETPEHWETTHSLGVQGLKSSSLEQQNRYTKRVSGQNCVS